jgi:hypothetical protein
MLLIKVSEHECDSCSFGVVFVFSVREVGVSISCSLFADMFSDLKCQIRNFHSIGS